MTVVYVLSENEPREGGIVKSVHATFEGAHDAAVAATTEPFVEWVDVSFHDDGSEFYAMIPGRFCFWAIRVCELLP